MFIRAVSGVRPRDRAQNNKNPQKTRKCDIGAYSHFEVGKAKRLCDDMTGCLVSANTIFRLCQTSAAQPHYFPCKSFSYFLYIYNSYLYRFQVRCINLLVLFLNLIRHLDRSIGFFHYRESKIEANDTSFQCEGNSVCFQVHQPQMSPIHQ